MKLITKSILYYLLISLPLLAIAAFFSYYFINSEVRDGTDESLEREKENAVHLIDKLSMTSVFYFTADSLSKIETLTIYHTNYDSYSDTTLTDIKEHEKKDYRILRSYCTRHEKTYLITLVEPTFEEDELVEGLTASLFLIIGFLVLAFFLVNWLISKTLWKPFEKTVHTLNAYRLASHNELKFDTTRVKEFQYLNDALTRMTNKVHQDYLQQKEFTENASHELQTPLAIIKTSLDTLFQSQNLNEEELNQLQSIERAINKLSALNKTLLLLTKIENDQFKEIKKIDLNALTEQLLSDFSSLYESKQIRITKNFIATKSITVNPVMAELLISNLLKNAFRHNYPHGSIDVEISDIHFSVSNTGEALTINKDELFNRFKKNDASKDSLGLGLAIVKSIISVYGYSITYAYKNNRHFFTINFN